MKNTLLENLLFFTIQKIRTFVVLVFCAVVLSVIFCAAFVPPKYRATATAVISLSDTYIENATQTIVETQAELTDALVNYLDEDFIFKKLSENLPAGLKKQYTAGELKGMLKASNVKEAFVLKTTANALDPNDAALLCNAFLTQGLDFTLQLIDIGYWEIVEAATVPKSSYYPSYLKAVLYGIIIGIVVFGAFALLYVSFNNKIVSKKELEQTFPDIPVLSEVAQILVDTNE